MLVTIPHFQPANVKSWHCTKRQSFCLCSFLVGTMQSMDCSLFFSY